jgi:hypothetical protein
MYHQRNHRDVIIVVKFFNLKIQDFVMHLAYNPLYVRFYAIIKA